jgi:hypothetical protein
VSPEVGVRHAWEIGSGISSDLWSMPSSHTVYAAALAVCLSRMYPRLTPIVTVLACIVGLARVLLQAHWASDVFVGAALGLIVAPRAMDGRWGQRVFGPRNPKPEPSRPVPMRSVPTAPVPNHQETPRPSD